MKTTEEIKVLYESWYRTPCTKEEDSCEEISADIDFIGGYRTAEAESQAEIERLQKQVDVLRMRLKEHLERT